jgi:hypothetical protein
VRAQIHKDLETNAVPETCLLGLDEVTQHLPMAMQGFSDFYTSLEHCQNCSGEMAAAKIPKNWFYVRPSLSKSTLMLTIFNQHRHHQSTTHASHPYFPRPAPSPDLRTCISPTASTQSLRTVLPGVWTLSLRWAISFPSLCRGARGCRSRTQSSISLVSCCLMIGLRGITSCLR